MPTITALEPQRRKGRLNLFVEGHFVIGVGESVVAELGLRLGQTMTAERLLELAGAEEVHKATEAALRLLEVRARAQREIETRLAQKGYEEGTIAQVVQKLKRLELIDDAAFAALWVEAKTREGTGRPAGKRKIAQDLMQKGVPKQEIAEALEHLSTDDELSLARAAAAKKVRSVPTDREVLQAERQKLIGFLQRRGFGWETIKTVTAEALPDPNVDDWETLEEDPDP